MAIDTRIPIPSFEATLSALYEVAVMALDRPSTCSYLDCGGNPDDLVAHTLDQLGAPIRVAAAGNREYLDPKRQAQGSVGTPWRQVRFNIIWDRLFLAKPFFLGAATELKCAEDYLVYALLCHVAEPKGGSISKNATWGNDLTTGLTTFLDFLNSPTSGFLVQLGKNVSSQAHKDLLHHVNSLATAKLVALKEMRYGND